MTRKLVQTTLDDGFLSVTESGKHSKMSFSCTKNGNKRTVSPNKEVIE